MLKSLSVFLAVFAAPALADIGRIASNDEVAAWNIDVRPDGLGLPSGAGSVAQGEVVFSDNCASCHGDFGEGVGRYPALAGGFETLTDTRPVKTVGSYWPYLSTVWDYVHRAMPYGDAQSLSDDEVYAVTAYILYLNDFVDDEDFVLSRENLAEIVLPNAVNFYEDDREAVEIPQFTGEPCMSDCKAVVAITSRVTGADVTPE